MQKNQQYGQTIAWPSALNMETEDFKNFQSLTEEGNAPFVLKKKTQSGSDFKIFQKLFTSSAK